jgi:pheromone receptor transcription factor
MKKAYELSTLTGTQVLLLVVSETGLVYTFTTAKLQPLVTQPEGKNLIQACLNAPHGSVPSSSLPLGTPINRSTGPISLPGTTSAPNNLPGGLSISGPTSSVGMKDDDGDQDSDEIAHTGRAASAGDKRRRRASSSTAATSSGANTRGGGGSGGGGSGGGGGTSAGSGGGGTGGGGSNPSGGGPTSPHSPTIPPPLSIPSSQPSQQQQQQQPPPQQSPQQQPPQISLASPTSPQQQHQQVPPSPAQYSPGSYAAHGTHHQHPQHQHDAGIYTGHMMAPTGPYSYQGPGGPTSQPGAQQLTGLAAAAAQQHGHWAPGPQTQVSQSGHYGRR